VRTPSDRAGIHIVQPIADSPTCKGGSKRVHANGHGKDGLQLTERLKVLRELFELDAGKTLDEMVLFLAGGAREREGLWKTLGGDPAKRDLASRYCALATAELDARKGRR
jgi:hypothetical protein